LVLIIHKINTVKNIYTLSNSFIHSLFITEIYIAPLQGYYSEALPTLLGIGTRYLAKRPKILGIR